MYYVLNGTLKVGQAEQNKVCALSLKTAEIFHIYAGGGGQAGEQAGWSGAHTLSHRDFIFTAGYRLPIF